MAWRLFGRWLCGRGALRTIFAVIHLSASLSTASAGIASRTALWPSGTKLKICYLDGTPAQRAAVTQAFKTWIDGTSLRLNERSLSEPDCNATEKNPIRVSFSHNGNWAFIGTQASAIFKGATLNLESVVGFDAQLDYRWALHDVGHILGLQHEHQHPESPCQIDFAKAATKYNWSAIEIKQNFGKLERRIDLLIAPFDKDSVMTYSFPEDILVDGKSSPCTGNVAPRDLSINDHKFIRTLYPRTDDDITIAGTESRPRPLNFLERLYKEGVVDNLHVSVPGAYVAWSISRGQRSAIWRRELSAVVASSEEQARQDHRFDELWASIRRGEPANALSLLKSLANNDRVPLAQILLASWFQTGTFVTANSNEAARYARAAGEQGEPLGDILLGLLLIGGQAASADPEAIAARFSTAAKKGSPQAIYLSGVARSGAFGVPEDPVAAREAFKRAAEANHPAALTEVGLGQLLQAPTAEQQSAALAKINAASAAGDLWATFVYGAAKLDERGRAENAEALAFIERAAAGGIEPAAAALAVAAKESWAGRLPGDWTKLLVSPASTGYVPAQMRLARALEAGEGIQPDRPAAIHWYEQAAFAGTVEAQVRLAELLQEVVGGDSKVAAAAWLLVASVQGISGHYNKAFEKLGTFQGQLSKKEWALALLRGARQIGGGAIDLSSEVGPPPGANGVGPKLKSIGTGTGTLISESGYVVTNHHVIRTCDAVQARIEGEWVEVLPPTRDGVFPNFDLAILRLKDRRATSALKIQAKQITKSMAVDVAGFPTPGLLDQKSVDIKSGTINNAVGLASDYQPNGQEKKDYNTFQMTVDIQPGNSGGPVIDETGSLVGIVVRRVEIPYGDNEQRGVTSTGLLQGRLIHVAIKARILLDIASGLEDDLGISAAELNAPAISPEKRAVLLTRNALLLNCLKRESGAANELAKAN